MIGFNFKFEDNTKAVQAAVDKTTVRALSKTIFAITDHAVKSIVPGAGPSAPGTPPHTHTTKVIKKGKNKGKRSKGNLQRATVYHLDKAKQEAVSGPRFSVVGESGKAHEFGGDYKGETYPARPFMGPALEAKLNLFGQQFSGSLGQ